MMFAISRAPPAPSTIAAMMVPAPAKYAVEARMVRLPFGGNSLLVLMFRDGRADQRAAAESAARYQKPTRPAHWFVTIHNKA
jgi:hypothetical protein